MLTKEHLFDKRVVNRALQEGRLDKAVYQRMLDELPDMSHLVQAAAPPEEPRPPAAEPAEEGTQDTPPPSPTPTAPQSA